MVGQEPALGGVDSAYEGVNDERPDVFMTAGPTLYSIIYYDNPADAYQKPGFKIEGYKSHRSSVPLVLNPGFIL